jgi:hypothetical protein
MVGSFLACCASAATGQIAVAPPRSVINSRRRMRSTVKTRPYAMPKSYQLTTVQRLRNGTPPARALIRLMSALGQKRTVERIRIMSAIRPITNIRAAPEL